MGRKRRKLSICANCNEKLKENMNFCHHCGQENHIKRASLKILFQDFFETYFALDSKFLLTLKLLITKPSFLSKAYLNGKIKSYLPPIRFYIFISFLFFLLLSITNGSLISFDDKVEKEEDSYEALADGFKNNIFSETNHLEKKDSITSDKGAEVDFNFTTPYDKKIKNILTNKYELKSFVSLLKSKLPIVFFFLIPVLAFLYFLVFYKKDLFYIDHLVFVLHLQSFIFLVLSVELVFNWVIDVDISLLFNLLILIYVLLAIKRFYNKKWWGVIGRFILIAIPYAVVLIVVMIGYLLLMFKYY